MVLALWFKDIGKAKFGKVQPYCWKYLFYEKWSLERGNCASSWKGHPRKRQKTRKLGKQDEALSCKWQGAGRARSPACLLALSTSPSTRLRPRPELDTSLARFRTSSLALQRPHRTRCPFRFRHARPLGAPRPPPPSPTRRLASQGSRFVQIKQTLRLRTRKASLHSPAFNHKIKFE